MSKTGNYSQLKTTRRYISVTEETVVRAGKLLDELNNEDAESKK
jgi:hypothetical protein